ncbi:MAG: hypothetical protein ACTTJZ_00390 [Sphaerochaetaceae bacterium]
MAVQTLTVIGVCRKSCTMIIQAMDLNQSGVALFWLFTDFCGIGKVKMVSKPA